MDGRAGNGDNMLKIKGLYLPMLADRVTTGDVYFLSSSTTNTNDAPSNGKDPSKPFSTLDYAQSKMTAGNDDLLVVGANHTETVTGAGGITFDVAGAEIRGLGRYGTMPQILMDGSTITGLVTGADMKVSNIHFLAGHADIACAFLVSAVGFHMDGCRFTENVATENFVAVLQAGVADNDYDGLIFSNNVLDFTTAEVAVLSPVNLLKDSKDVSIIGNKICGDFDTTPHAPIYSVNTEHHMNIEIAYNLIHNQHNADEECGIFVGSTSSTGWMHHNLVSAKDAAGATPFLAAAGGISCFENYYVGDDSVSGYILPAIGAN
jgi:hypothetical protein